MPTMTVKQLIDEIKSNCPKADRNELLRYINDGQQVVAGYTNNRDLINPLIYDDDISLLDGHFHYYIVNYATCRWWENHKGADPDIVQLHRSIWVEVSKGLMFSWSLQACGL